MGIDLMNDFNETALEIKDKGKSAKNIDRKQEVFIKGDEHQLVNSDVKLQDLEHKLSVLEAKVGDAEKQQAMDRSGMQTHKGSLAETLEWVNFT